MHDKSPSDHDHDSSTSEDSEDFEAEEQNPVDSAALAPEGHPEAKKRKRGRRGGRKIRLRRLAREAVQALDEQERMAKVLGLPRDLVISAGLPLIVAGMASGDMR